MSIAEADIVACAGPAEPGTAPRRRIYPRGVSDASVAWEQGMVARLAAGDDRALAAIYDQYSALVHGIAQRLLGAAGAADVTQQVFLRLWERPESFDPQRGSLRTFLAIMARRRSIDTLRGRARSERRDEWVGRQAPAVTPDVDEAAMAMIASERVRAAVAALPPDQRRAIELAYFEGLTFREVAVATGVAEGTAKSRLRLALGRLAAHLHDDTADRS
jgi:RNA polymerase sigma-70 factor (ECF subfamily)